VDLLLLLPLPISKLAEMCGLNFILLQWFCIAVWILRIKPVRTNFKVPALPVIAVCGIAINIYLMTQLRCSKNSRWLVRNRSLNLLPLRKKEIQIEQPTRIRKKGLLLE
jgi:hypothetical protein